MDSLAGDSLFRSDSYARSSAPVLRCADPASDVVYASRGLAHVEPIQGYTLQHVDNAHIHTQHAAGTLSEHHFHLHSRNAARSLAAHSMREREWDGLVQPFPDEVTLNFHAFGREFHLPHMQLMAHLMVPFSKTIVVDSISGTKTEMPNVLQSYHYTDVTRGIEATATIHANGLFHALVHEYDTNGHLIETFQIDPLHEHAQHFEEDTFQSLTDAAAHSVVAFKHSDLEDVRETHQCAAAESTGTEDGQEEMKVHTEPLKLGAGRKLLAIGDGVTRWTKSVRSRMHGWREHA
jgi:hypothetical protein